MNSAIFCTTGLMLRAGLILPLVMLILGNPPSIGATSNSISVGSDPATTTTTNFTVIHNRTGHYLEITAHQFNVKINYHVQGPIETLVNWLVDYFPTLLAGSSRQYSAQFPKEMDKVSVHQQSSTSTSTSTAKPSDDSGDRNKSGGEIMTKEKARGVSLRNGIETGPEGVIMKIPGANKGERHRDKEPQIYKHPKFIWQSRR